MSGKNQVSLELEKNIYGKDGSSNNIAELLCDNIQEAILLSTEFNLFPSNMSLSYNSISTYLPMHAAKLMFEKVMSADVLL